MIYDDYDKFQQETGLIDDDEQLRAAGATREVGESEDGRFDTDLLGKLRDFCRRRPRYHILTLTSDGDDAEPIECARRAAQKGIDWEAMDDEAREAFRQEEEIYATTIDNQARRVNRLAYYLGTGNASAELNLLEFP